MGKFKLAIFDMDGTLINGRTIFVFAEKKGFSDDLTKMISNTHLEFYKKSTEIAKSLKGMQESELLDIFRSIPLNNNVEKVIKKLKDKKIKTAIVTDSYQFVAEDLKKRLTMDYAFANNLIIEKGIVKGYLEIHNTDLARDFISNRIYSICKDCVLDKLCETLNITANEVIAVGDGRVDIGMLKKAGLGIAFNSSVEVKKYADVCINDMIELVDFI